MVTTRNTGRNTTTTTTPTPTVTPPVTTPPPAATTTTTTTTPSTTPANTFTGGGTAQPLPTGTPSPGALGAVALRAAALGVDPALIAKFKDPQQAKKAIEDFSKVLIATDGQVISKKQEKKLFQTLAALSAAGQLVPALTVLANQSGALPANLPPEKKQGLVMQFAALVEAEIIARGANGKKEGRFPSWQALSNRHLQQVHNTKVPPQGPPAPSAFLNPTFVAELEKITGTKFTGGNTVKPLINGPASFAERNKLIDGATKSIHVLSWAFYDDATGDETTNKLIAAHKRGVDVKVMVDGNVARQPGHDKMLARLEAAGIPVVRWTDKDRPHDGQHRKCMVVDGSVAVAGGMNVGDVYSHKAGNQKWRDTDARIEGPAVVDAARLFARLWNEQIKMHNLPHQQQQEPPAPSPAPAFKSGETPSGRVQVIDDVPGPKGNAHILLSALKAIEGATGTIDIENAYLITTPALQEALVDALKRGVKVRILTNSPESVDEPIVSAPIQQSLPDLIAAGAEVYLKQGDTLHSKFLVVDGLFSMVKSYNLHPRSERYEGEVSFNVLDQSTAAGLTTAFEDDIKQAKRLHKPSDVVIPKTAFSVLARRFFFDQL